MQSANRQRPVPEHRADLRHGGEDLMRTLRHLGHRPLAVWRRLRLLPMYRHAVYTWYVTEVPMREPTFLILTALAAGAQHGYGIMADVAQISGGRVRLRAGTLYAALNRLAVEGLVEMDREEIVDARLRRYYRLTPPGTQRLRAEVGRMRRNATVAATRLALPGSPA